MPWADAEGTGLALALPWWICSVHAEPLPCLGQERDGNVLTEQAGAASLCRQAGDPRGRQEGEQNRPKARLKAAAQDS